MAEAEDNPVLAPPGAKKSIAAWWLYDWANSAFATVVITFIFSVFFTRNMIGDETAGAAWWGYAIAASGLIVAVLGPILGAAADHSGARKRWIFCLSMLCIIGSALLWYAQPATGEAYTPDQPFEARLNIWFVLGCVVIANVGYELSAVFYNAMLTHIAPRHLLGRVSGWGWGIGYLGGLAALAVAMFGLIGIGEMEPWLPVTGADSANIRATGPLTALWFFVFMIPLLLWTHDVERSPLPFGRSVRLGLSQLRQSLREVRHHKNLVRFLVASAIYRDGLNTLFTVGGIYAAGVYGMDFLEILQFAIGLNIAAGAGALAFAHLDDRIGSKPTVLLSLAGLILVGIGVLLAPDKESFVWLSLGLGAFVGPVQAASRTLAGRLAPHGMIAQTYGLYAFTGKSVAFAGPLLFGAATHYFGTQQAGMAVIVMLWAAGFVLLTMVEERRDD